MQNQVIEGYRLSPQQERLWALQQGEFGPTLRAYCAALIEGQLNIAFLQQALDALVERRQILRTAFQRLPGMNLPLQVIAEQSKVVLELRDCEDGQQWSDLLREFVEQEQQEPLEYERLPLMKATLARVGPLRQALLLSLPALCADTAGLRNLIKELCGHYAFYAGDCSWLEDAGEEPVQYNVVSEWLNQIAESEETGAGQAYWRQQHQQQDELWWRTLKEPNLTALRLSVCPPAAQSRLDGGQAGFEIGECAQLIDAEARFGLEQLGRACGAGLEEVLVASMALLLWRHVPQERLSIGLVCDGRTDEKLQEAIGVLARQLPLTLRLTPEMNFPNLVEQTAQSAREMGEWQEFYNWKQFAPGREPGAGAERKNYLRYSYESLGTENKHDAGGLKIDTLWRRAYTDGFELRLCSRLLTSGWLELTWCYDTRQYSQSEVELLMRQYEQALKEILGGGERRLDELRLTSEEERRQLRGWNDTAEEYEGAATLQELFESQAALTPENIALVYGDEQFSYRELNEKANQVARLLSGAGVGSESTIGIMMERSAEMVVAILGALKSGGAYLPLDPTYPQQRLSFMLNHAGISYLLTHKSLLDNFAQFSAPALRLDADWPLILQQRRDNPDNPAGADNLAYVIYTSGSTGMPKGVMISHYSIRNRLIWMQQIYKLTSSDRVLQKTPFSFDVSVWEFFWPLITGATLVVARPGGHQDSDYLARLIIEQQVSTLHFVPSMLQVCLDGEQFGECKSIKRVICSGEALGVSLVKRFYERASWAELWNLYGPTEAAVDVTSWRCEPDSEVAPIGRPIANTRMYVLDRDLQPLPPGVRGELYIGGVGLARGYLKRAELTADRFIPDGLGGKPGDRLYRTGDLARYLADGEIEYLGRIDEQVKVRGYRIEPGEIEAALSAHSQVRENVVIAREDRAGDKRLVAYVVPVQGQTIDTAQLRRALKERLPDYMVPAAFVLLDELPLTPNGKINRRALPALEEARRAAGAEYVRPRTETEEALCGIWGEVLGVEKIGVFDNFFELGGDSILSIQIIARANSEGIHLIPRQLFQHQTVAELAAVAGATPVLTVEQDIITGPQSLTPIQHWFFEQNRPEPEHWNQAVLFSVPENLDPDLLARVVQHLLTHHDALRLRFLRTDSGWRAITTVPEETAPFTQVDFSHLPVSEQAEAVEKAAAETHRSLNLEEGPLFRVALFNLGRGMSKRLLIVIHHLAVDGVSWRILLDDLQRGYEQMERGESVALPLKTTSFKHWAERLAEYAASDESQAESAYWLAESWANVRRLPVDFPGGANVEASARTVSMSLSVEETRDLLYQIPAVYHAQVSEVLLTALSQALTAWGAEPSVLIDLEGHGREEIIEDADVSRTVGWFTTIFPMLLNSGGASNPGDALKSIKERLRRIPQRGIGFGILRYLSNDPQVRAKFNALPRAEVSFNYLGQFDQVIAEDSMFEDAPEACGPMKSPKGNRSYLLEMDSMIAGGRLQITWTYSVNIHRRTSIETLAENFVSELRELIAYCRSHTATAYTPSDFTKMRLNQEELDDLMSELESSAGD